MPASADLPRPQPLFHPHPRVLVATPPVFCQTDSTPSRHLWGLRAMRVIHVALPAPWPPWPAPHMRPQPPRAGTEKHRVLGQPLHRENVLLKTVGKLQLCKWTFPFFDKIIFSLIKESNKCSSRKVKPHSQAVSAQEPPCPGDVNF